MYLRADIDLVPGKAEVLERCLTEFLVPVAMQAGWQLVISLHESDDENKIVNIWDVGNTFSEGIELMHADKRYPKYKALLAECVAQETHTMCDSWR